MTEPESAALGEYLDGLVEEEIAVVSSMLLETELRRLATRLELSQVEVSEVLNRIDLYELDRAIFVGAGLLPGKHLRSLDALHVAVAIRVAAETMVTYDDRQTEAARSAGLTVVAPAVDSATEEAQP